MDKVHSGEAIFRCVGGVHFIMFGSGFSAFAVNNLRKEKS